jgi:hypothetical protein
LANDQRDDRLISASGKIKMSKRRKRLLQKKLLLKE